jgi:hypothetical protein
MKKRMSLSVLLLLVVSAFTVSATKVEKKTQALISKTAKVEVYYFHFTRRCVTCQAVEAESKSSIEALYPAQARSGLITFKSINLDEENSGIIAKKCKADGQSLLIISGNKRIDLTEQGFMYAKSQPEKLKSVLKKTIDPLLK